MAGFFQNLKGFRDEKAPNQDLHQSILATLKSLHISCGTNNEGPSIMKSNEDFIGLCILHPDGEKVLEDSRGRRIRSGYVAVERRAALQPPINRTLHRQTYDTFFHDVESIPGVVIVGFSQKNKILKGVSGTFNSCNSTNLLPGRKECLFSYRSLIFGAVIMHKLNKARNISPHSACYCLCFFLIVKRHGDPMDKEKFPVADLELESQDVFLEEMFQSFGIQFNILDVAFRNSAYVREKATKKAALAMQQLVDGLKADLSQEEFIALMKGLMDTFDDSGSGMGGAVAALVNAYAIPELEIYYAEKVKERNQAILESVMRERQQHRQRMREVQVKEKVRLRY